MQSDILVATEVTAIPIFWAENAIKLKQQINSTPIIKADLNQGSSIICEILIGVSTRKKHKQIGCC